jgi:AcrR family transcriptional regulator
MAKTLSGVIDISNGNLHCKYICRDSLALSSENIYDGNIMIEPKRSYHHGNLKEALVLAGVEILEAEGLAQLSLRAIAARVGVSHTAPKNHFGSMRGLLTAIATEGFRRHAAFMRAGLSEASGRKDRLNAAMQGYVRFAREHKQLFLLMFSSEHCDFSDPDLGAASKGSYDVLADIAAGLDWDKAAAPGGQQRTELMLWSLVHGFAQLSNAGLSGPQQAGSPANQPAFDIADIMPDFHYFAGSEPVAR